jgi:hypothetical protein
LRSPFFVHRKRGKTAVVSLTVAERTSGSVIGALNLSDPPLNDGVGYQFEKIKHQSARGCGE